MYKNTGFKNVLNVFNFVESGSTPEYTFITYVTYLHSSNLYNVLVICNMDS